MEFKAKNRVFQLFYWFFVLVFSSCAQIVAPTGGKKDTAAPRVVKYVPDSAAINFNAKNIAISFDEYIQLNDLQKQLVISPPMDIQPEVKIKGKTLLIELKDTLKKNTTYTLNFGNSIQDISESNPKQGFQYVFSTGSFLDTLKFSGTVKNAFDLKTDKGVLVMLYDAFEDSLPYKKSPSYLAITNADGSFRINNIRAGAYKAFALKESDNNLRYNSPEESIGFSDTLIKISQNTVHDFMLFKEEPKKQRMLKNFVGGYGRVVLVYAKSVSAISYKGLNAGTKTETFLTEYNYGRDTITVWFPSFTNDSLHFQTIVNENITDTLKICTCRFQKKGRGEVFKLNATTNIYPGKLFDGNKAIELRFNHPIDLLKSHPKNVYLTNNSVRVDYTNTDSLQISRRHLLFKFPIIQDSSYKLFIPPATFTDIFGLTSDTIKAAFKVQEEKYYGSLKLNLKMKIRIKHLVQLINDKGEIFDYVNSDAGIFTYTYLPPGPYKLRIIYDRNGDDKWTTGNYTDAIGPETVIYYPGEITIRPNWELELDWSP